MRHQENLKTKVENNSINFPEQTVPFAISTTGIEILSELSNYSLEIIQSFDILMLKILEHQEADIDNFKQHLTNFQNLKLLLFEITTLENH